MAKKKFKSASDWIRYHLEEYGRDWVTRNYELHKKDVPPVSPESFSRIIRKVVSKLQIKDDAPKTDYEESRDSSTFTFLSSHEIRTLEDAVDYAKIDTVLWEPIKIRVNSWGSESNPNYQVRVECRRRETSSIESILNDFREEALNYSPKFPKIRRGSSTKEGVLAEVSVPDLHFGQLSWAKETLDRDYDIKIAERMFVDAVEHLIANVIKMYKVEHFLFPIGNDFFNVNSALNTTFRGTPQSEDDRGKKSFTNAWKMLVKVIEKMLSIADVTLLVIPGNHDYEKAYYLGEVLYAWFKNCENVTVDNSPSTKKYFLYGNSLIGFLHQIKKRKLNEYPLIMANDVPNLWNKAKFTEIHTGHLHKERIDEIQKTKIVSLPSLVSLSEWASNEGFNHLKEAQLQVWTKDNGKRSVLHYYPSEELYGE